VESCFRLDKTNRRTAATAGLLLLCLRDTYYYDTNNGFRRTFYRLAQTSPLSTPTPPKGAKEQGTREKILKRNTGVIAKDRYYYYHLLRLQAICHRLLVPFHLPELGGAKFEIWFFSFAKHWRFRQ
jgi:hypothetical protein